MAGRETSIPKGSVSHCRSRIHRAFSHIVHKRRNVRFKRLRRVHTPPHLLTSHTPAHTPKHGAFRTGRYHYPRSVLRGSETLRGRVSERRTLPLWGLGRVYSRRTQRAFGTAMCLYASLFRGAAAPLGCVILSLVFQHCVLLLSMWNSHTTQTDWYHHSRLVLHAVEPPTSGHRNGLLIVYCSVWQILY